MNTFEKLQYAKARLGLARAMGDTSEVEKWREHVAYWEAAQHSVQRTCAQCGADDWRDAIIPDTLEICNRCGAIRCTQAVGNP